MLDGLLLVLLDDVSQRELAAYDAEYPGYHVATPTIDSLAAVGRTFTRVHSMPVCSATRVSLMHGVYPRFFGVGETVQKDNVGVPIGTPTLAALLSECGVQTALFGKWHLTADVHSETFAPNQGGFSTYRAGILAGSALPSYFNWTRVDDGVASQETRYATSAMVDACVEWLVAEATEPWFCVLSLNAPHAPFEVPPEELLSGPALEPVTDRQKYELMLQAADTELARVLEVLDLGRHAVVVAADNGTPNKVHHPDLPGPESKATLFRDGIEVPFLMAGAGVAPGVDDRLGSLVDVPATVLELFGAGPHPGGHGISLVSAQRDFVFAEHFGPNGPGPYVDEDLATARGKRWKYMRRSGTKPAELGLPAEALYDLAADPEEEHDLLVGTLSDEAAAAYRALALVVDRHTRGW